MSRMSYLVIGYVIATSNNDTLLKWYWRYWQPVCVKLG